MPANTFLSVFAKSPIKPIEEHIRKVHQASEQLLPFFAAVYQKDWIQAAEVRKVIVALEFLVQTIMERRHDVCCGTAMR